MSNVYDMWHVLYLFRVPSAAFHIHVNIAQISTFENELISERRGFDE